MPSFFFLERINIAGYLLYYDDVSLFGEQPAVG
jgi:hypothetical protein